MKRILFPTDLSEAAEPAKALALALAERLGAEVLFLHVVPTHAHDFRQRGDLLTDFLDKLEREAERRLDEETQQLREEGFVARHTVLQAPSVFEAIRERMDSWEADLIVMATHGRSGMERWFLGSIAEKTVRHAACPVITVRPPERDREPVRKVERILVPVDFSDSSRRAVLAARGLLGDRGTLIVQHVIHNPTLAGLALDVQMRLFAEDPTLEERVRNRIDEWMGGEPFESIVTEADDVCRSILETAETRHVDLIVVGRRGSTGVDYFLTGSVAEKIVRASSIPVMTVK